MNVPAAVGFALILLTPGLALAQSATAVEQVGQQGRRELTVDQVSGHRAGEAEATPAPHRSMPQVARGAPSAEPGAQLTAAAPTADAPASGTDRSQGLNVQAAALGGEDRCDAEAAEIDGEVACEQVIETRSAEFRAPDPAVLTPEQRLIIAQRELRGSSDPADAVRRLGNGEIDDSTAAMAVASTALQRATQQPDEEQPEDAGASATDAVIAAIINSIGAPTP